MAALGKLASAETGRRRREMAQGKEVRK